MKRKVLVLLSGGLDSAIILAAAAKDHDCEAIGFDYDQPHVIELEYAEKIAAHFGVRFRAIKLPKIPLTDDVVFAGRNLVLAAHAISIAVAEKFDAIAVGSNQSDWARFPDCRPPFWRAMRSAAEVYGIQVVTPLMDQWKATIVERARILDLPLSMTWSCYAPFLGKPCGKCLACKTRKEGVNAADNDLRRRHGDG